jgi:hypothetical protein
LGDHAHHSFSDHAGGGDEQDPPGQDELDEDHPPRRFGSAQSVAEKLKPDHRQSEHQCLCATIFVFAQPLVERTLQDRFNQIA